MQNTRDYVQQKETKAVQVEDNREKPKGFRLLLCERRERKKTLSPGHNSFKRTLKTCSYSTSAQLWNSRELWNFKPLIK